MKPARYFLFLIGMIALAGALGCASPSPAPAAPATPTQEVATAPTQETPAAISAPETPPTATQAVPPTPTEEPTPEPASKQEVITSLADDLIAPRFQAVADKTQALDAAINGLCANPTPESLDAARSAWRDAREPWMRSQATWFGPVMDRRSRSLVDWSPIDAERIEKAMVTWESITATQVLEFFSSTQRGLGTIEYFLFGDDGAVLEQLGESNAKRCQYMTALSGVIATEMAGVRDEWTGDSTAMDYASYYKGTASVALLDQQAVDEAVRTSVFLTRNIADMRLGKALGVEGAEPDPSVIPGSGGNNAVADIRNQVIGMQDVYLGADTEGALGVSALVQGVSPEADERMRGHFTALLEAVDQMEEPLHANLVDNPAPIRNVQEKASELQRAINTEVVSLLGVTVGFSDTDGDGG